MAKSNNPYASLNLHRERIPEAVDAAGGRECQVEQAGTQFHIIFQHEDSPYRMSAFFNNNGSTTLSCCQGADKEVFDYYAEAIKDACSFGTNSSFHLAIPRFPQEHATSLIDALIAEKAEIQSDEQTDGYRMLRLKSPQGDTLTVKYYSNRTLQLQGKHAMLAAIALDKLSTVLDYKSAVEAQLTTFKINLRFEDVEDELEAKWNPVFNRVSNVVRPQLASALALTKLELQLPDYAPIAFPALRGLEGFLKTELESAGFDLSRVGNFGEYFEGDVATSFKMRDIHKNHLDTKFSGIPFAEEFAKCYTKYNKQRHGLFHMGTTALETRTLPDIDTAKAVVAEVFDTIDKFCRNIPSS